MKIFIFILLISLVFLSCNNIKKEFYPNGKLKLEYNLINGEANGLVKEYYENGNLKKKLFYLNDLENGPEILYYPTGEIRGIGNSSNGKGNGVFLYYYKNGKIEEIINCENDLRNGMVRHYYKSGVLQDDNLMYDDSISYSGQYNEAGKLINIIRRILIIGPDTISKDANPVYKIILAGPINNDRLHSYCVLFPKGVENNNKSKEIFFDPNGVSIIELNADEKIIDKLEIIVHEKDDFYKDYYHRASKYISYID